MIMSETHLNVVQHSALLRYRRRVLYYRELRQRALQSGEPCLGLR